MCRGSLAWELFRLVRQVVLVFVTGGMKKKRRLSSWDVRLSWEGVPRSVWFHHGDPCDGSSWSRVVYDLEDDVERFYLILTRNAATGAFSHEVIKAVSERKALDRFGGLSFPGEPVAIAELGREGLQQQDFASVRVTRPIYEADGLWGGVS